MTMPKTEIPKCISAWLRTSREYVTDGVYRSPFNGEWLYSVYTIGAPAYHQVISRDRANSMLLGELVRYMMSVRDIAGMRRNLQIQRQCR